MLSGHQHKQLPRFSRSCDPDVWKHVWNPGRLQVIDSCTNVSGKISEVRTESDGDLHILMKPDKEYLYLLTTKNIKDAAGCLVVELVCVGKVKDKEAKVGCSDYKNTVYLPEPGEHVIVTGSLVTDLHHGWNEIHPVTAIKKLK